MWQLRALLKSREMPLTCALLAHLGIIERREVGLTVLVSPGAQQRCRGLIDSLARLQTVVIARSDSLPPRSTWRPSPSWCFGSLARREANADSDIDVLAVRPPTTDAERWAGALSCFADQAGRVAGNPVQVLDYEVNDLRRRAGPRAKLGKDFWDAARRDAIVLTGRTLDDIPRCLEVTPRQQPPPESRPLTPSPAWPDRKPGRKRHQERLDVRRWEAVASAVTAGITRATRSPKRWSYIEPAGSTLTLSAS